MSLSITSINVRGLRNKEKCKAIFDYYRSRSDILCIQESHSEINDERIWENEWGGKVYFCHGSTNSRGCMMCIKRSNFMPEVKKIKMSTDGRYICCDMLYAGTTFNLINVYAPNKDSPGFFEEMLHCSEDFSEKKVIIGDFNLTLNISLDRKNSVQNNHKAAEFIKNYMDTNMLEDVWRVRNEEKRRYSWYARGRGIASRLDFVLASQGITRNIQEVLYIAGIHTDHSAIHCVMECHENIKGPGYWKMNTNLIKDTGFLEGLCELVQSLKSQTMEMCPISRWEYLKTQMKKWIVEYSRTLASEKKLAIAQLSEHIADYEDKYDTLSDMELSIMDKSKAELDELMMERARGLIFRSKVRWYEEGEKNSKYFFALEKMRYNARTINILTDEHGKKVTNDRKILAAQREYYKTLFTKDPEVNFELENSDDDIISPDSLAAKNTHFSVEEIAAAIKGLNNGRTPGSDGLPIELYKVMWLHLKDILCEAIEAIYEKCECPSTMATGIINLIPKPGKDSSLLKNLRPITLLNSDYKIIEKAIAIRVEEVMSSIIHEDQQGFMKNRKIFKNIRKIFELVTYTKTNEIPAYILQLDWSKCFDKIDPSAIQGSLKYYGFSEYIRNCISILYSDFSASIQNNGNFSNSFRVTRSVHQGAPCSSLIFLLCAEIFAKNMRNDNKILGISIGEFKYLLGQYADDTDMSNLFQQESLDEIMRIIELFRTQAGFTLNYDKTTAYQIGSIRNSNRQLITQETMSWTNEGVNVLGVYVSDCEKGVIERNYLPIMQKVEDTLRLWSRRTLSLRGKILVINTLIASLFVYKMLSIPGPPEYMLQKMDRLIEGFVWGGHKPKISLSTLKANKENGGCNLVDLKVKNKSLKVMWKQILDKDSKLANLVYSIIDEDLREDVWLCETDQTTFSNQLLNVTSFWREVLIAYQDIKPKSEKCFIWCNKNIKVEGKEIFLREAYQRGLKFVHQMYRDGVLKTVDELKEEFGLSVMQVNSIITACPKAIRNQAKLSSRSTPPTGSEGCLQISAKSAYKVINDNRTNIPTIQNRWCKELECDLEENRIVSLVTSIDVVTIVPKYRSFIYRLYMRALVTNIQLKHWKMRDSNLCSFCKKAKETYLHLFVVCDTVNSIWEQTHVFIEANFPGQIDWTPENILFARVHRNPQKIQNYIVLITLQYIYRQRCLSVSLSFKELRSIIWNCQAIEKYIAQSKNLLSKHVRKWQIH